MASEAAIERRLREGVHRRGGWCIKLMSLSDTGLPDRCILMPGGLVYFVELKSPTGRGSLRKSQLRVRAKLQSLDFTYWLLDTREKVDAFLLYLETDQ